MVDELYQVNYYNSEKGIGLTVYADTVVIDQKTNQLVLLHFAGYPETVKAMADAIYGGGTVSIKISKNNCFDVYSVPKGFTKKIKKDGIYTECRLERLDDDQKKEDTENRKKDNDNEENDNKENSVDNGIMRSFLFIKDGSFDKLYRKIDLKSSTPMIEGYKEYIINEMLAKNSLYPLKVYSIFNNNFKAYCMLKHDDDKVLDEIVEKGILTKALVIPGVASEHSGKFEDISGASEYLARFGSQIAEKIKKDFVPLFDPSKEDICDEIYNINENLFMNKGFRLYHAQMAVAEAMRRKLSTGNCALCVAECGAGKTKIGSVSIHSYFASKKVPKYICIIMGPSHLGDKWVREVEETLPNTVGLVIYSLSDLNKAFNLYQKNDTNMYLFVSKERARDGYMKKPAVRYSKVKQGFVCRHCNKVIEMELDDGDGTKYRVTADEYYFRNETSANHKCLFCNAVLWEPVNPSDRRLDYNKWVKVTDFGWVHRDFINRYISNEEKSDKPNIILQDIFRDIRDKYNCYIPTAAAYRKYSLSLFIKKKLKGRIDACILDELHLYKGDTGQGISMADIAQASKKVIAMTATLINGYSSGIFYLLFRLFPHFMLLDGQNYNNTRAFNKQYGVYQEEFEMKESKYNNQCRNRKVKTREKLLPGVSPLVFTRFLLDTAVFLSLLEINDAMPEYEEIPHVLSLESEVRAEYDRIERQLKDIMKKEKKISHKILGKYLDILSIYPDQPYGHKPILDPLDGSILVEPLDTGDFNSIGEKEKELLDIVEEKVSIKQRVLIYTNWIKTDTQSKLQNLIIEKGYRVKILTASVSAAKRESWLTKTVCDGIDVLITNPSLVETGLDLNDFTTIIYYNVGYNLFTFRQSSKRSWRINQAYSRVEVHILCYENTMQHRAIRLMGTKLSVATTIEGNVTDEGLAAMSDCQDLTTALVKELTLGIDNVEDVSAIYKKMAILKPNKFKEELHTEDDTPEQLNNLAAGSLLSEAEQIIKQATIRDIDSKLTYAAEFKKVSTSKIARKNMVEGQLDLFSI